MEGQVITPPSVTVPAGSVSATFTTTAAPEVNAPHWVFIGARYGTFNGVAGTHTQDQPGARSSDVARNGPR